MLPIKPMIETGGVFIYEHGKIVKYMAHQLSEGVLYELIGEAIQQRDALDEAIENMKRLIEQQSNG